MGKNGRKSSRKAKKDYAAHASFATWNAEAGHQCTMTRTKKEMKELTQQEVEAILGFAFQLPDVHDGANGPIASTANRADELQSAPKESVASKPPVTANPLEADSGLVSHSLWSLAGKEKFCDLQAAGDRQSIGSRHRACVPSSGL